MKKPLASFFSRNLCPAIGSFAVGFAVVFAVLGFAYNTQAQTGPPTTSGKVVKWDQPPVLAAPTNVFYGWNEPSVYGGQQIAADDWVCTTTNPVMKIRWWGSFIGFNSSDPSSVLPPSFAIHFWNDVPKGSPGNTFPFSHPANAIWQISTTNYTATCVGKDYDPRTGTFETCFLFEADLSTQDWFFQNPANGTNIYWLSIAADYPAGVQTANPFGWKTRPRDPNSPAPDSAIDIFNPTAPVIGSIFSAGNPIAAPTLNNQWDLAFELVTAGGITTTGSKWEQLPDLSNTGIDVNDTFDPQLGTPRSVLASDFLCTNPGFITNIVIWGSWSNDIVPIDNSGAPDPGFVQFTLSYHADIKATTNAAGTNYSRPGPLLWTNIFVPGQFLATVEAANITEGWMDPPANFIFPGDHTCYRYEFNILPASQEPFFQQGTATNPVVYWLDVQATIIGSQPFPRPVFGWKTSVTNWNDDSTWAIAVDPPAPPPTAWNELRYPPTHPFGGKSIDLAFRLNTQTSSGDRVKWSQPPVVATNVGNWYNGWNEPSIDGGGFWQPSPLFSTPLTNIVADDWLCTNPRPVTDIHWWGSFLNWTGTAMPSNPPVAYRFAIWTDFPTNVDTPFSHPGTVLWSYIASTTDPNLKMNWVGWDLDPRTPCLDMESCFKFDYYLPGTNNWFFQQPGTNIYWLSISAIYPTAGGDVGPNPFGWKTRPHYALDDAVRIYHPLSPMTGLNFGNGQPIIFPAGTSTSWDMAFRLTSCQQHPHSGVVFTNITVTNVGSQQVINLQWNPEASVVYQVQEATSGLSNLPTPTTWTDLGPVIIGPANTLAVTNPISIAPPYRFYRICVPDICP